MVLDSLPLGQNEMLLASLAKFPLGSAGAPFFAARTSCP
jgi:hypothetical protein